MTGAKADLKVLRGQAWNLDFLALRSSSFLTPDPEPQIEQPQQGDISPPPQVLEKSSYFPTKYGIN